jgi:two-component system LytT family response regulator
MQLLRAILVDDEFNSLQNLEQKLVKFCPDIQVVAAVQKPDEAILLIRQHRPDVIFLDIEMPRMNGFRMLDELGQYEFEIVFTTAYNHYAVDAIRISAFDYLTKPIAIKDLQKTVERLALRTKLHTKDKMEAFRASLLSPKSQEEPYQFFRVHNSHLINLTHIKKYSRGEGGQVVMQNDDVIDISRRKKDEFLKLITI